jgi:hypothetical protein
MADMKQIFTYPSNSGTDWIDPLYIGNSTSGLTRRVDELLAGSYKSWSNLDPVSDLATTNSELMQNLSKFINYFEDNKLIENLTFYDFWYNPMVVGTKKLIDAENVTATATNPMVVTTSNTHEYEDGMKIDTTNINGTWGDSINNGIITDMYVKVINNTTLQIAQDSALTNIIGFTTNSPFSIGTEKLTLTNGTLNNEVKVDLTGAGVSGITDGQAMQINSLADITYNRFTGAYTEASPWVSPNNSNKLPGSTRYLKTTSTVDVYEVYDDSALTNRTLMGEVAPNYNVNNLHNEIALGVANTNFYPHTDANGKAQVAHLYANNHPNPPIPSDQLEIYITPAQIVRFTNGEAWGSSRDNSDPYGSTTPKQPYWLEYSNYDSSTSTYYYNVYSDAARTTRVDWSTDAQIGLGTPTAANNNITIIQTDLSDSPSYQNNSTDTNATIQALSDLNIKNTAVDGDPITITGFDNQFSNNPYYIKKRGTADWWDIYKDSALTQLYTIADSPGIPSTIKYSGTAIGSLGGGVIKDQIKLTYGSEAIGAGTNNYQGGVISTTMIAQKNMPDWGITSGQTLNASYDSNTTHWTIDNSSQQTLTITDASSPDLPYSEGVEYNSALQSYSAFKLPGANANDPTAYQVPMFWVDTTTYAIVGSDWDFNVATISSGNMKVPSADVTIKNGSGWVHGTFGQPGSYLLVFAENSVWDDTNMAGAIDCVPRTDAFASNVRSSITFSSTITDDMRYGHLTNNNNSTVWARNKAEYYALPNTSSDIWDMDMHIADTNDWYDYSGTDTFIQADNIGGGVNNWSLQLLPEGAPNPPSSGNVQGNSSYSWAYVIGEDSTQHWAKPINRVKDLSTNSGYPTSAILTGSTLAWNLHSVDWDDGDEINLFYVDGTTGQGGSAVLYAKNLATSGHYEFYTDQALTTPYLTSTFTSGFTAAGLVGVSTAGVVLKTFEPVASGLKWVPYTTNQALITGTRKTVHNDVGRTADLFNDTLYAKTWSLDQGTIDLPNKVYDAGGNNVAPQGLVVAPTVINGAELQISGLTLVDTTAGQIAPASDEPYPYELDTVDIILPGNIPYSYQDSSNVTQYAAQIDTKYWSPGQTSATTYASSGETSAQITIAVNGSGYLQSATLVEEPDAEGRYANGDPILIPLINLPNQYTPPTPTAAELEDVWDTDDEWASDGDAAAKQWPDHVTPQSAVINYNSPTIANSSQSGIKYTRSVGHTKWRLEVDYPPMKAEDFQKFHAIAQAAHGQSTPFYFNLKNKDNVSILWKDFYDQSNTTTTPLFKNAITPGNTLALFEGFSSNESNVFMQGEVFIDGENENGNLHTSLSSTSSNIFGEAKIRTPWPFRTAQVAGTKIYKNPAHAIVTLASDNFEYQVDVNNYYYVSVAFDLDSWK